jgi:uncharacterized BrkB/YihY/UPF0761 family membrane protein
VLGLPLAFLARYTARQGILLASAAAFRLFLWLLPLALLIAGVLAAATGTDGSTARSVAKTSGITGEASKEIAKAIASGHQSWVKAVVVGTALFLWATRALIRYLTAMNAHVWQVPIPKQNRLRAELITTLSFAGACVVIIVGAAVISRIRGVIVGAFLLGLVVEAAAVTTAWLLVCLRLPDGRTTWTDLLPGSMLVGVGLVVLNTAGQIYIPVRLAHASELYGPLGTAGAILAWLLIIGQVMVSGAITNSVWAEYRRRS